MVERRLMKRVKDIGGWATKIVPASHSGLPDRLVFLPDGRTLLVELKRPGGKPTEVQLAIHRRLAKINHPVAILDSTEAVDEWVDSL